MLLPALLKKHRTPTLSIPPKEEVFDTLLKGFWVFFFAVLIGYAATWLLNFGLIPRAAVLGNIDSFDTILTIKITEEVGIFNRIPFYDGDYSLFGMAPVLIGILGAVFNVFLHDAPLSMLVVHILTEAAIACLIFKFYLKDQPLHIRIAIVLFFLVNLLFVNPFPYGGRLRQQLALLFGMLLFMERRPVLVFTFALFSFLSQPFTAMLLVVPYIVLAFEKQRTNILPAAAAIVIGILPYYKLALSLSAEPVYSVCTWSFFGFFKIYSVYPLFYFFVSLLLFNNLKKLKLFEFLTAAMIYYGLLGSASFSVLRDVLPVNIAEAFLGLFSHTCEFNFLNTGAFLLLVSLNQRKFEITRLAVGMLLLVNILNLAYYFPEDLPGWFEAEENLFLGFFNALEDNNVSVLKSMSFIELDYSNQLVLKPELPFFPFQGYNQLYGNGTVHFLDEVATPPEMSRGESNVLTVRLAEKILNRDSSCADEVGQLKRLGVQGVAYQVQRTLLVTQSQHELIAERFSDREWLLEECSLELDYELYGGALFRAFYKIKDT